MEAHPYQRFRSTTPIADLPAEKNRNIIEIDQGMTGPESKRAAGTWIEKTDFNAENMSDATEMDQSGIRSERTWIEQYLTLLTTELMQVPFHLSSKSSIAPLGRCLRPQVISPADSMTQQR